MALDSSPNPLLSLTLQSQRVNELLSAAIAHHQNGQLAEAYLLYKTLHEIEPKNAVALRLSGLLAYQLARFELSLSLLSRSIALKPDYAEALNDRGLVQKELKRFDAALADYDKAISLFPNYANALNNRGVLLKELKRFDEAMANYDKAISIDPSYTAALNNRGNLFKELRRFQEAIDDYSSALALKPSYANALNNRGLVLYDLQRFSEAKDDFNSAISIKPNFAAAFANRGDVFKQLKHFNKAIADYSKAILIKPDYLAAFNKRGNSWKELGRFDEALADFNYALSMEPNYVDALNNRGNLLRDLNRSEDALADYDKAISLSPNNVLVLNNRGRTLTDLRRFDEALADYDRALSINPNYFEAQLNKSLQLLLQGEFALGWALYESRWKRTSLSSLLQRFDQPLWLGKEDLNGKTILLHWEQGLGDTIQFSRFAKNLVQLGAKTILEVQKPLFKLLKGIEGVDKLIASGDDLPPFDFHCPLMSLPLALETTLETIPSAIPYIRSGGDNLAIWSDRLGPKSKPRVGIVWSGSASHKNDRNRSIGLEQIIGAIPNGYEIVSLQKDVKKTDQNTLQILEGIKHFGKALDDFTDTAALCELVDIIVSVDTSVAHLAGALGKPVHLLLPYSPDFRWLLNKNYSPWYPSMKLFRQGPNRAWKPVFKKVKADLKNLI